MWKPNRQISTPVYMQIVERLKQQIMLGEYPPGSPLPSERRLAELFGVNRSTIVLAYTELRAEGFIETQPSSKTIVSMNEHPKQANQTPDWQRYTENGSLLPNLPYLRKIREALAADPGIIDFASGKLSLDLSPVKEINEIMKSITYQPEPGSDNIQGFPPLQEALVTYLRQLRGIETTPASIIITSGSQQSLYLITQCLLSPGDAIAVEEPSFTLSLSMFRSAGLRMYRLPMDEHGVRPEGIHTLYKKHRIKMLFISPNFQNPTGTLLQQERRRLLLETAQSLQLPVVEDDQFSLTSYEAQVPPPLKAEDTAVNTLYIGSFSKIAASGLRIGWIVAPHSIVRRLADARRQMDLGFSVIPQQIAAQFITSEHFAPHLERLRQELTAKRDLMVEALQQQLGDLVQFSVPQGGLHLWCKIVPEVHDGKLLEQALQRGIAFVPGSLYGAGHGFMRLTYARPDKDSIASGVSRLTEAIHSVLHS